MKKFVLLALMAAVVAGGCRDNKITSGKVLSPVYPWIYYDGEIQDIGIVNAIKTRSENGLMRVQVQLRNERRATKRIVYKVIWLDAQGFTIPNLNDTWTTRILNANESIFIDAIAPAQEAADCRIQLQKSERD